MARESTKIVLPFPPHFSWQECLWFLDRGYNDCMHRIQGTNLWKAQVIEGQPLLLKIGEGAEGLTIAIENKKVSQHDLKAAADWVRAWLDMDRDLDPFYRLLNGSAHLSQATQHYHGLRLIGIPDLYEALCWCIIGQQIHLRFAHSVKRQFVQTFGRYLEHEGHAHYLFPEPAVVAQASPEDLYALQFSRQKADYILHISRLFATAALSKGPLDSLPGTAEKMKALLAVRGVGPWTANYVGMKTLRCMDCIPYGDAGLHQALGALPGFTAKPGKEEVDAYFSAFKGWESYLVFYLWRSLYAGPPTP